MFNGVRLRTSTWASMTAPHSDYRIRLNADIDLDIPDGATSLERYCATLSHKANHSNAPNAEWALVEHPRFGLIRGLRAVRDIAEGQEVLVNYHMNLADAPLWYRRVWLGHQRRHKKLGDDAILRLLARYTENTTKRVDLDLDDDAGETFEVPEPRGIADGELDSLPTEEEDEAITGPAVQEMREKMAEKLHSK